jgi:hypothetical protein
MTNIFNAYWWWSFLHDILETLVEHKRWKWMAIKVFAIEGLAMLLLWRAHPMSLSKSCSTARIIAELSANPYQGWIHEDADPMKVIPEYCSGALAPCQYSPIPIFRRKADFIKAVRPFAGIPILRKDFISTVPAFEADWQADAVQLIAVCRQRMSAGPAMKPLVWTRRPLEIHSEAKLD